MPRVTVSVGKVPLPASAEADKNGSQIVHSEIVSAILLDDEHASVQVLERLAWAISDAELMEQLPAN